LEFYGH